MIETTKTRPRKYVMPATHFSRHANFCCKKEILWNLIFKNPSERKNIESSKNGGVTEENLPHDGLFYRMRLRAAAIRVC